MAGMLVGALALQRGLPRTPAPETARTVAEQDEAHERNSARRANVTAAAPAQITGGTDARTTAARTTANAPLEEGLQRDQPSTEGLPTIPVKRSYLKNDFRGGKTSLAGYKNSGFELTAEGLKIGAGAKTELGPDGKQQLQVAQLESPSLKLSMPSNMVLPIWRTKDFPAGSTFDLRFSISPDNEQWSEWFFNEGSDEPVEPTYPDGSPNPNYGMIIGNPISHGVNLSPYVKYQLTVKLPNGQTRAATVEEIKFYHVDSAGPDGHIADVPPSSFVDPLGPAAATPAPRP